MIGHVLTQRYDDVGGAQGPADQRVQQAVAEATPDEADAQGDVRIQVLAADNQRAAMDPRDDTGHGADYRRIRRDDNCVVRAREAREQGRE